MDPTEGTTQESLDYGEDEIPYLHLILKYMTMSPMSSNVSIDFRKPYIKPSLRYVYPLFIFLHTYVTLAGTIGNVAMLVVIVRRGLYRNPTFFFLGNIALSDIIKSAIVVPLTIANLLIQNWIFGSFLCFFLPMLHSFPIHASMLTYAMIAIDRYRFIVHPMKSRVPAGLCTIAVWVVSVCVVLPYAVYIQYVDLGNVVKEPLKARFDGVGVCWLTLERNIEEYIRAMFVTLYCLPLAVIAFLYVKVSAELKVSDTPVVSMHIEAVGDASHSLSGSTHQSHITWTNNDSDRLNAESRVEPDGGSNASSRVHSYDRNHRSTAHHHRHDDDDDDDDDIDNRKEKRTQKYMITMVTLFAVCWCPVTILTLVTHFVYENDENSSHFDITYLTFIFFGFLSTCINPVLFASWRMSDQTKDRLRGYFRFSNRRPANGQAPSPTGRRACSGAEATRHSQPPQTIARSTKAEKCYV